MGVVIPHHSLLVSHLFLLSMFLLALLAVDCSLHNCWFKTDILWALQSFGFSLLPKTSVISSFSNISLIITLPSNKTFSIRSQSFPVLFNGLAFMSSRKRSSGRHESQSRRFWDYTLVCVIIIILPWLLSHATYHSKPKPN